MKPNGNHKENLPDTQTQIIELVLKLLQTKEIDRIKVTEVTRILNISRGTFYLYYESVFDVLQQCEDQFFHSFMQMVAPYTYLPFNDRYFDVPCPLILMTISFFKENKSIYTSLLGRYGDPSFAHKVRMSIRQFTLEKALAEKYIAIDPRQLDMVSSFILGGHFSLLQYLSANDFDSTDEEIAVLAYRLIFAPHRPSWPDKKKLL